jgi:Fe-S cluster assembly protein SufD
MRMTFINPEALGAPRGYNNGVLVEGGHLLFVAGQIAWDSQQRIVSDDFSEQFARALANVIAVVRAAGGAPASIAQMRVYVTDKHAYTANLKRIGAIYREMMGRHYPAMALVQVADLLEDGALVEIDAGAQVERTLNLAFLSAPGAAAAAAHPRVLVVAGEGSRAAIVETYRGDGAYLLNEHTEVALGDGAELALARVQEEGAQAFHVGLVGVRQGARSRFTAASMALGGALARVELRPVLDGEGGTCELDGLYVAQGRQLLDHLVHVDHARPRCTSRQTFKGILGDSARGVFAGRILVREGAQKTDAEQVNSNLLLSDDATIDTKPQLEILTDDVKCSHGGTVGQIREDHLFYLRSRGIPQAAARALLTWAFASEMVQRVEPADARARVRAAVTTRLPGGAMLEEAA